MSRLPCVLYVMSTLLLGSVAVRAEPASARLMHYPDISNGRIAFIWSNDVWILAASGGSASRLTADGHPKTNLHFSPDGAEIGYTMTVAGNPDIYVLSTQGGVARRITHHPGADQLVDWYPDGLSVLIASSMLSTRPVFNRLFKVAAMGGLPTALPLAYGETAALSPSGQQVIYTVYRDFQEEAWKRYRGGRAPDLWYYDLTSGESKRLTHDDAPDSWPMWAQSAVYFLSERGPEQRSNVWALDLQSSATRQLTHFTDFDVRHPAYGDGSIVFEAGGRLYALDPNATQPREIVVTIEADRPSLAPSLISVADKIEHADFNADGSTVAIAARGDVFKVTREPDLVLNVSRSPDVAERYPSVSPDGRRVAYFSDAGGEYQLCVQDLAGSERRTLTRFKEGFRYKPQWSADQRSLAFIDNSQAIHMVDVQSGRDQVIDHDTVRDHPALEAWRVSWSADSRWMAYTRALANRNHAVFLFDATSGKTRQVTSGAASDVSAVFGPEGDYLYLLSYRELRATYGDIDPTWTYADSMGISIIPLRKSVGGIEAAATAAGISLSTARLPVGKPLATTIELEGLEQRLVSAPIASGTLSDLYAARGRLFYRRIADAARGGQAGAVEMLDIKTGHVSVLAQNVEELVVATEGDKALIRRGRDYFVMSIDAQAAAGASEVKLPTERLQVAFDRRQENRQQFADAWRYVRDFFYDPQLHGVDWRAIRERYQPLVDEAATDEDMSALLREIAGELSAGHVWAFAGDDHPPGWADAKVGLLGADFESHAGGYRIARILDPGPNVSDVRSPLADPALGVHAGDYLVAVNGVSLSAGSDPFAAFENQVGIPVSLRINSRSSLQGSREIVVRPLSSESKLRELDWVEQNRVRVAKLSGGRVGYIYVPDTGSNGQNELMAQYRAYFDKPALIIDERFNRGGALGDRLIELLNRPSLNHFVMRNAATYALPELSHDGPKVMMINGWSYSGGDGFPFLFKSAHVGTLVGTRTWGGLIGPSLPLPLISGGKISVANQRVRDMRGEWAEGNHGVVPDIEIDNDPAQLATGTDQQLDKAMATALEQLAQRARQTSGSVSGHAQP
jgi:tricorn protease